MGIQLLGHGLDWWNGALLFALVLAAVAAFAMVATTTGVIIVQKREARASAEKLVATELKLEQLRKLSGPRDINFDVFKKELEGKAKAPVVIWYLPDSSDGWWFASRLEAALNVAGWNVERPIPIPAPDQNNLLVRDTPRAVVAGGQPSGVTIVGSDLKEFSPAGTALMGALSKSAQFGLGSVYGSSGSQFMPVPVGTLRIIIAAKTDPLFISPRTPDERSP